SVGQAPAHSEAAVEADRSTEPAHRFAGRTAVELVLVGRLGIRELQGEGPDAQQRIDVGEPPGLAGDGLGHRRRPPLALALTPVLAGAGCPMAGAFTRSASSAVAAGLAATARSEVTAAAR